MAITVCCTIDILHKKLKILREVSGTKLTDTYSHGVAEMIVCG